MIRRSVYKSRTRIPAVLSCIRNKNEQIEVKNEDIFIYYDFIRRCIPFSDKGLSIPVDRQTGYVIPSGFGIPPTRAGIEERAANIWNSDTIPALQLSAMVHVTDRKVDERVDRLLPGKRNNMSGFPVSRELPRGDPAKPIRTMYVPYLIRLAGNAGMTHRNREEEY
ncbi:MAG: hypothetical protein APR55_10775 [Methanolinea sp. SDB]|nr:MAG: hypothetical protein APR55_10775 [Methanolinea sp. SDB]